MRYPFLDLTLLNQPWLEELKDAAMRVISSGRYIGGDEVEALEADMAELCGITHAVGVSNGLDALTLILKAYIKLGRLNPGDGVIVPANTYIATMLAVTEAGLTIMPVDIDETSMNISASDIPADMLNQAKAIMPVHLYGRTAWSSALQDIASSHNLLVVEDSAQSIGARSSAPGINGGHTAGGLGHASGFSFYPTKNIGALGDAGMVTTDDAELASTVRTLANYGSDRRYHNIYCGNNCRLDPIQAAMIRVKLHHIDEINTRRRENATAYDTYLTNQLITKPAMPSDAGEHVWHQYVIYSGVYRDRLQSYLTDQGVGTDIHYATPPLHQPCYSHLECHHDFPVTDRLADGILSLPISEMTAPDDIKEISAIINRFEP